MLKLPEDLSGYSRPDLIKWVCETCVTLPHRAPGYVEKISLWCEKRWGEQRAGNILHEAMEGWIDYFDGDWQIAFNPWCASDELIIWVSDKNKLVEFALTWG